MDSYELEAANHRTWATAAAFVALTFLLTIGSCVAHRDYQASLVVRAAIANDSSALEASCAFAETLSNPDDLCVVVSTQGGYHDH